MELNPRILLPGCLVLLASLLWINNWQSFALGLLLIPGGLWLSRAGWHELLTELSGFRWLLLLNLLLLLVFPLLLPAPAAVPGVLHSIPELIQNALLVSGRLVLILALSLLFVRLAGPEKMLDFLGVLAEPLARLGLPARRWVFTISLAWRLLPVIREDSRWLHYNLQLDPVQGKGIRQRLRSESRILLPLLQTAFDRAEDIQTALLCRGCRPDQRPVSLQVTRGGRGELLFVLFLLLWILLLLKLRTAGGSL